MRWLKRSVAWMAARLGLLSWLSDVYYFRRNRSRDDEDETPAIDDGMPVPPAILRNSAAGTTDLAWFLSSGRLGAEVVERLAGSSTANEPAILDFGCGSGRVLRHLHDLPARRVHGVDWNRRAIRWCAAHLEFATFSVGSLEPPLSVEDPFDLIYAFSVFTHLEVDTQRSWLRELRDHLAPDGLLAISTSGDALAHRLDEAEERAYAAGEIVVRDALVAGTNLCAAWHPPGCMESMLPPGLEILRFDPEGALGNPPQDLWILRRAASRRPSPDSRDRIE